MSLGFVSRFAALAGSFALAGAGVFGAVTSAFGAITLQVERLNGVGTAIYSVPGRNHNVGWNVTVKNTGAGPSSPVLFFGRTRVLDPKEKAVFDNYFYSGADPRCRSTNLFPTAVGCLIPGLHAGQTFTFAVSYKTPLKFVGGIGAGDVEGTDYVNFRGTTIAFEDRDIFVDRDPKNRVTLLSENDTQVTAVCPPGGCTVFTGTNGGIPTATDHYTTEVTVPVGARPTTVSIVESLTAGSPGFPCTNFMECWTSELTIPSNNGETFSPSPLALFLRQDLSTIQCDGGGGEISLFSVFSESCSPVPIGTVVVVYVVAVGESISTTTVGPCTGGGEGPPALGEGQHECVAERTHVTGTTPNGYYEFKILSDHNGGWGLR